MSKELEEGRKLELDWNKLEKAVAGTKGIIPVAVQHADTQEVILVAYINKQAFEESLKRRMLVLWSSSRQELWIKGLTSGETFELLDARVNCEQNSLLFVVRPNRGGICHTKNKILSTTANGLVLCVTITTVLPAALSAFNSSMNNASPCSSKLELGSSNTISLGMPYTALASASRCLCPPDKNAPAVPTRVSYFSGNV